MARWDKDKKLFYYTPGRNFETGIKDTDQGNFYRSIFPYHEVPKIDFDMRLIPIQPADDIFITDTTFRDGQQSMAPFSVEQIERIYDFLTSSVEQRGSSGPRSFSSTPAKTRRPWRSAWPKDTSIRR